MTGQGDDPTAMRPVIVRLAATVLLLRDDPFEVLMVKPNARGFFPSALVFPGGVVEAIAAARARPRFPVHSQAERRADGLRVFIPEATGYPVSEGFIPSTSALAMHPKTDRS